MTAKQAAEKICPDIGHPLDPNNEMQAEAVKVIQQAIDAATVKLKEELRLADATIKELESFIIDIQGE